MPQFVLASSSPRRRRLLEAAGYDFVAIAPGVDEASLRGESPSEMVGRLAALKAAAAGETGDLVVGVDTTVVCDGVVLGKPHDEETAVAMLLDLAGRTHTVLSGWAILRDGAVLDAGVVESTVTMRAIEPAEARAYAATGEPLDKAGAYALQGRGGEFVLGVSGPRSNVIGLPLRAVVDALRRAGVEPSAAQRGADDPGEVTQ